MGTDGQRAGEGKFHFTLLVAVEEPSDLLTYQPAITDENPHSTAAGAWRAGSIALTGHQAVPKRGRKRKSTRAFYTGRTSK